LSRRCSICRGFAFVRFPNRSEGEDAQRGMDGKTIDGNVVTIQEAKEKRCWIL
jgi:RNA recognition motif-containing protein